MLRPILTLLTAALLAGCANETIYPVKPPVSRQLIGDRLSLVGTWLADQPTKEGGRRLELSRHRVDGTYETFFRITEHGRITLEQTETGLWGYSDGVYFTITKATGEGKRLSPVDPTQATYYDAYRVISLDGRSFVYRSPSDGNVYRERKVPDNFQLPSGKMTTIGVQ